MRISQENVHRRGTQGDQSPPPQGPQILERLIFSFPKSARILKRGHFKAIAKRRKRFYGSVLVINFCPASQPRLGITVTRQFGNAVKRNRFKRRVREAFRLNRHELAPFEMVIFPRKEITHFTLEMISSDLLYHAKEGFVHLGSARQSQIDTNEEHHSQIGKGDEER